MKVILVRGLDPPEVHDIREIEGRMVRWHGQRPHGMDSTRQLFNGTYEVYPYSPERLERLARRNQEIHAAQDAAWRLVTASRATARAETGAPLTQEEFRAAWAQEGEQHMKVIVVQGYAPPEVHEAVAIRSKRYVEWAEGDSMSSRDNVYGLLGASGPDIYPYHPVTLQSLERRNAHIREAYATAEAHVAELKRMSQEAIGEPFSASSFIDAVNAEAGQ